MKRQKVISDFEKFISIQSVSMDSKRFSELIGAADFLSVKLKSLGFKAKLIGRNDAPPLVIARLYSNNPKAKTIGIYGHYDVQPEDPVSEWKTPPFKLVLKKGSFFGRGVSDNKGPIIQNIAAIENLIEREELNNNIIFLIEGEEESGGSHFERFVSSAKKELNGADCFYVTDVNMFDKTTPQILYALRGLIYFEITLRIGETDLHSGSFGNLVLNPAQVLSELFAKIKSYETGKIKIPGFYKGIRKMDLKEIKLLKDSWVINKSVDMKTYSLYPCDKKHPWLSSVAYPSMDISGLNSGYSGSGAKTIIPSFASAKFSFRLVEYQDPAKVEKLVRNFIEKEIPKEIKYKLKLLGSASPFYTSLKNPYIQNTAAVLEKYFKKKPKFARIGASIPAAEILQKLFSKPIILTTFVNPDNFIHAPNENLDEDCFWKGIEALERIYSQK